MALSFPLALEQFCDGLMVRTTEFDLGEAVSVSETWGGEVIPASNGSRLWTGSVTVMAQTHAEADRAKALLNTLREPGASFLIYDMPRIGPAQDPEGDILGATLPTLGAVASNNKDLQISGLPGGYTLTPGDKLGFHYLGSPLRYALHEVVHVAGSWIEVRPHIRPGFALGAQIYLIRPNCKARIIPGSATAPRREAVVTRGITFRWKQTLR